MSKSSKDKKDPKPEQTRFTSEPDSVDINLFRNLQQQLAAAQAEIDALKECNKPAISSGNDNSDRIPMAVPFAYSEDPRALQIASGRCEVRLCRVEDMYRVDSLVQALRERKLRYMNGHGVDSLVDRPLHAFLWLLQNIRFDQDVVVVLDDENDDDDKGAG